MKRKILTSLVIFSILLLPSVVSVGRAEDPLRRTEDIGQLGSRVDDYSYDKK